MALSICVLKICQTFDVDPSWNAWAFRDLVTSPVLSPEEGQSSAEKIRICQFPFLNSRTRREGTKELRDLCTNLWIHGRLGLLHHTDKVVLVGNVTLRLVRQFCADSILCRYFCGSKHVKASQARTSVIVNSSTGLMRRVGIIFSDLQRELKANNWCMSHNEGDGSKKLSDIFGKLWVVSSARITASWTSGQNLVPRAITLTCSIEKSRIVLPLWNSKTVGEIGNLSCKLEKKHKKDCVQRRLNQKHSQLRKISTVVEGAVASIDC